MVLTERTRLRIRVLAKPNATVNVQNAYMMIERGDTATSYEPYVTPRTYQFSLGNNKFYNIGTYRDYILRTTGKNKFDEDVEQGAISSTVNETYAQNKVNNATRIRTKDLIALDKNKTYTISCNSNYKVVVQAFNENKLLYVTTGTNSWVSNTTITNVPYIAVAVKKTSEANITPEEIVNAGVQLEQGSTATDYEPHGVGVWYKYGKIGEKIFTGASDETWTLQSINQYGIANFLNTSIDYKTDIGDTIGLCNYFEKQYSVIANTQKSGFLLNNQAYCYIRIESTIASTIEAFKTWLQTHNTQVIYVKATPTIDIITETLAEQLEAWWNGQSLDGTTIIEGNGDLPMIIKVRGLKGE